MNLGQTILDEIIKQGMVNVVYPKIDEPIVFLWNDNAAEQIEAIVMNALKENQNEPTPP